MQDLLNNDELKQFRYGLIICMCHKVFGCRFLGKVFAQYINTMIEEGEGKMAIFNDGFDFDRWKRTQDRNRNQVCYNG